MKALTHNGFHSRTTTLQWLACAAMIAWFAAGTASPAAPLGRGSYAVYDLGTLGGMRSEGYAINANGDVAGYSYARNAASYGFISRNGAMHKLDALNGGKNSVALGLNDSGVAVGYAEGRTTNYIHWTNLNNGQVFTSVSISNYYLPCRWSGGGPEVLDRLLPDGGGHAQAINSSGGIAGYTGWSFPDQANTNFTRIVNRAVRWGAGVEDLGPAPWSHSYAYGINDLGDAVGSAIHDVHTNSSPVQATLFRGTGGALNLHSLPGLANSVAYGMNNAGQVVGAAYNISTRVFDEPFIWTAAGGMRKLTTPSSDPYGQALDINEAGIAVGVVRGSAVMWLNAGTSNESRIFLQDLVPSNTPWRLAIATSINEAGEITGYTSGPGGHAYLLYPTNTRHRIEGSVRVVGTDTDGLLVTNLIVDAALELVAFRDGTFESRESSWTDANGNFSFLMRAYENTTYAVRIQLADQDSLVAVHDGGRSSNEVAWLRTPVFTVDRDTRADVLMTINANTNNADHNETTYEMNGVPFTPALVAPPAVGAPGPASNSGAERFAHAAVIYRNTLLAARFAVDKMGVPMPLVPVYAFIPGRWGRPQTNDTRADIIVRETYLPATHCESAPKPLGLFIADVASAYNEPFVGISAVNPVGALSRTTTYLSAGGALTNHMLRGRNRPDNREFHEYSHAIMFVSDLSGANHLPGFVWEDQNNNFTLDPGEDANSNGRLDCIRNHGGLANSDSSDSWVEGWAEFLSAVISTQVLDRREKPSPNLYCSQGTIKNLDDTYGYGNSRSEEYIVAALLWDFIDEANAESETLQLPWDRLWSILAANGPALQTFHDVVETLLVHATNSPFELPPAAVAARLIESDLYDDLSLPDSAYNYAHDPGETLGVTSWNPNFAHRNEPSVPDGTALLLTATDVGGAVLADVLFEIAIEYDAPLAERNTRYTFAAPGMGPHGVPISLPPHASRARVQARKPGFALSAAWVVTSEAYWAAHTGTEDQPVEPFFATHTFVLGAAGADLAMSFQPAAAAVPVGGRLTFKAAVTNLGPLTATNVKLTNSLPAGVTFVSALASKGTWALSGSNIVASIDTLAAGSGATVQITIRAHTPTTNLIVTASSRADELDTTLLNNQASLAFNVVAPPAMKLSSSTAPPGLVISWPDDGAIWSLEAAMSLTPPVAWIPVSVPQVVSPNGERSVTLPPGPPAAYFRLRHP